MGQTVSVVAKTVSSVASSVTRIADCVDNEFSKNSPIFAYGMYFDNVYTLFQYDMYLEELKDFLDVCGNRLKDNTKIEEYEKKINNDDRKLKTIVLLNILHLNVVFLRKIIIYSSMAKKNQNDNSKFEPLVKYSQLLIRLFVIKWTVNRLYELNEDFVHDLMLPNSFKKDTSDLVGEVQRLYKIDYYQNNDFTKVDNEVDQMKQCLEFIKEITNTMSVSSSIDWKQINVETIILVHVKIVEAQELCRTLFIDVQQLYSKLSKYQ
jgi:hypothetical protein